MLLFAYTVNGSGKSKGKVTFFESLSYVIPMCVLVRVIAENFIFCLTKTEKMETCQDMLLFDINMSITTRANEFGKGDRAEKFKRKDSWFPLFSFASISAATDNFSIRNKLGEGGFGPVYKVAFLSP